MSNDGHYKIQFNLFTTPRDLNKIWWIDIYLYLYQNDSCLERKWLIKYNHLFDSPIEWKLLDMCRRVLCTKTSIRYARARARENIVEKYLWENAHTKKIIFSSIKALLITMYIALRLNNAIICSCSLSLIDYLLLPKRAP